VATTSLYRRYRPRRFAELKGQDHVVRALRDAVASGREGQAYLFSGPRGTGKTSSARILAKVLNCERPVDGEPCCECLSCLAVERGTSYDVHELDAASNNGVDAMRDLIERASLGTPGRHKVYILDEVHMLSKAAEAALLKTLEEPPSHVVFVLATTDPQRVSETIRSRTQHLRFHLLPAETLAEHVRWVVADAGLDVNDAAIDAALAQGAGSARDTLSALELIASAGAEAGEPLSFDEFVEAFIEHDPGRVLAAMAAAVNAGHEPRTVADALVRHLRNGFLSLMAPELVQLSQHQADELAAQARLLGPASIVRGIERLGEILVELRHAPDPRVLVEVALVQLSTAPAAAPDDVGALAARVTALEQAVAAAPSAASAAPVDPATGRAALGGRARSSGATAPAVATAPSPPPASPAPTAASAPADPVGEWENLVRPSLKGIARALYTPIDVVGGEASSITIAVPNATHRTKCEQHRTEVEQAWSAATGRAVTIELVVADTSGSVPRPAPVDDGDDRDDVIDPSVGEPAPAPSVIERLAQAFPGAELVEGRES
jgi:DNA polymerase III subunit gamma/tau